MLDDGDVKFLEDLISERLVRNSDEKLPERKCVVVADLDDGPRELELPINPNARRVQVDASGRQKCISMGLYGGLAQIFRRHDPDIGFELIFESPDGPPPRFLKALQNSARVLQSAA